MLACTLSEMAVDWDRMTRATPKELEEAFRPAIVWLVEVCPDEPLSQVRSLARSLEAPTWRPTESDLEACLRALRVTEGRNLEGNALAGLVLFFALRRTAADDLAALRHDHRIAPYWMDEAELIQVMAALEQTGEPFVQHIGKTRG